MTSLHTLLVLAALAGPDAALRTDEASARPAPPDLPRLRELLYTRQEPQEQSQAALLLVQSRSPEALELIREGLRRQDRPDVFQALTAAIRLRRDPRHLDALLSALASETPAVRESAVDTLAALDSTAVVRQLVALAEDPTASPLARQAAVMVLGRSVQKSSAVALMSLLSSDHAAVRQAAVIALEELTGQTYGPDPFRWQTWWEMYAEVSEDDWLRLRTAYLADRARRLRDELLQAENQVLQLNVALYGKIPSADRPAHLRTLVQSSYPGVRSQAVTWIVELLPETPAAEQKALTEILLLLSEDGIEPVQRQAVLALEKVSDPRAFERLLVLLKSGPASVRAAAARSLGRYSPAQTVEGGTDKTRLVAALEEALGDSALAVVAEAAESLGGLGVPEAAPILAGLLRHPSDPVRQAAARGLEQVAHANVLADLQAALDDPVPAVRFSLVGALGKVGASSSLSEAQKMDILKRLETVLLRDGDPGVRSRAATVIGDQGTAAELPLLWQRVHATEDSRVQLKAWTAMIEILNRSVSWTLVSGWDQTLADQKELGRRVEMLTEIRSRWLKLEAAKPHLEQLTAALVQAQLAQRKWNLAMPLARELAKKAPDDAELRKRLRWLLVAGNQAIEDKKPQEVLQLLKDVEELLVRAGELAAEFDALKQRAHQLKES